MTVPPAGLIAAASSGVIVTLIASLKPAWDVTRITPMQALRVRGDVERQAGFFMRHGGKIGLALMAIAAADQAALYPTWRAVKTVVVEAIKSE